MKKYTHVFTLKNNNYCYREVYESHVKTMFTGDYMKYIEKKHPHATLINHTVFRNK